MEWFSCFEEYPLLIFHSMCPLTPLTPLNHKGKRVEESRMTDKKECRCPRCGITLEAYPSGIPVYRLRRCPGCGHIAPISRFWAVSGGQQEITYVDTF